MYNKNNYINNHYDECYLITKDVSIEDIKLQEEEVADIKYFSKEEIVERIDNNYDGLTEKTVAWHILKKILKRY